MSSVVLNIMAGAVTSFPWSHDFTGRSLDGGVRVSGESSGTGERKNEAWEGERESMREIESCMVGTCCVGNCCKTSVRHQICTYSRGMISSATSLIND